MHLILKKDHQSRWSFLLYRLTLITNQIIDEDVHSTVAWNKRKW
jgi:hypothetical protein